jgi:hypothetical protein
MRQLSNVSIRQCENGNADDADLKNGHGFLLDLLRKGGWEQIRLGNHFLLYQYFSSSGCVMSTVGDISYINGTIGQ